MMPQKTAKRHVLMFEQRFVGPIEAGSKRHTIRPPRKRSISVGDSLSLRCWAGKAYRSRQRTIADVTVTAVRDFWFEWSMELRVTGIGPRIVLDGVRLTRQAARDLAVRDGFPSVMEMYLWHMEHYDPSTTRLLIEWRPIDEAA